MQLPGPLKAGQEGRGPRAGVANGPRQSGRAGTCARGASRGRRRGGARGGVRVHPARFAVAAPSGRTRWPGARLSIPRRPPLPLPDAESCPGRGAFLRGRRGEQRACQLTARPSLQRVGSGGVCAAARLRGWRRRPLAGTVLARRRSGGVRSRFHSGNTLRASGIFIDPSNRSTAQLANESAGRIGRRPLAFGFRRPRRRGALPPLPPSSWQRERSARGADCHRHGLARACHARNAEGMRRAGN